MDQTNLSSVPNYKEMELINDKISELNLRNPKLHIPHNKMSGIQLKVENCQKEAQKILGRGYYFHIWYMITDELALEKFVFELNVALSDFPNVNILIIMNNDGINIHFLYVFQEIYKGIKFEFQHVFNLGNKCIPLNSNVFTLTKKDHWKMDVAKYFKVNDDIEEFYQAFRRDTFANEISINAEISKNITTDSMF